MTTRKFDLSLRLRHPEADLTSMADQLGAKPTTAWTKGDRRRTLGGKPMDGTRDSSYCSIPLEVSDQTNLGNALARCAEVLTPIKRELWRLIKSGGTASIAIGWFCDGDAGDTISTEVLDKLSGLKLTLDFYLYFESPKRVVEGRRAARIGAEH